MKEYSSFSEFIDTHFSWSFYEPIIVPHRNYFIVSSDSFITDNSGLGLSNAKNLCNNQIIKIDGIVYKLIQEMYPPHLQIHAV